MSEWVMVPRHLARVEYDGEDHCAYCGPDFDGHSPECPMFASPAYEITEEDAEAAFAEWQKCQQEDDEASGFDGMRAALTAFVRRLGGAPITTETKGD